MPFECVFEKGKLTMIDEKLYMKAQTTADCDVISTLLQDAIFHTSSYSYHEDTKCLRLMLNRFCWELMDYPLTSTFYRVHSGIFIYDAESVICDGRFKKNETTFYNLLAFHVSDKEINMCFSDNHHICVKIGKINVYMKDLHDKYPTEICPVHKVI